MNNLTLINKLNELNSFDIDKYYTQYINYDKIKSTNVFLNKNLVLYTKDLYDVMHLFSKELLLIFLFNNKIITKEYYFKLNDNNIIWRNLWCSIGHKNPIFIENLYFYVLIFNFFPETGKREDIFFKINISEFLYIIDI